MSSEPTPGLSPELLDDFYAECDEQLTAIRESVVALEPSMGLAQADVSVVERLFRSFHSFKGNAAIVGLRSAEELTHAAEGFLRELARASLTLGTEGLDLLMTTAQRLEQMVAAHREKRAGPGADELVSQFQHMAIPQTQVPPVDLTAPPVAAPKADFEAAMEEARARGMVLWRFRFTPSSVLDSRGINVNVVRARIAALGNILRAVPEVRPGGKIAFEFTAALSEAPAEVAAWETDGIEMELVDPAPMPKQPQTPIADLSPSSGPFVAPSHVVRVDLSRLDDLMRITGEMVIHRSRLEDQITKLSHANSQIDTRGLQEINSAIARDVRELRESIMRVRLVPVAEIFARMPFVVRDLARGSGKHVRLTLAGQQTEIDKYLVERLKDPLLHLVRNSVSHGIESPVERIALGKPAEATIFLRASTIGDFVLIEIGDDGRGVDAEAVSRRAVERGMPVPAVMDPISLLNLICSPGLSTREEADRASGRGVGMAVVNNVLRELGGTLSLETGKNRGVKFNLRLPLTLAIADVFIVSAGEQTCAVPQSFVREVMHLDEAGLRRIHETQVIPYRNGILPLVRLRGMFGLGPAPRNSQPVLVLNSERGSTGLVVDRIHGQREVVVRAMRDPLIQVSGVAGATELGDGRPVLILDAAAITSGIVRPNGSDEAQDRKARPVAIAI